MEIEDSFTVDLPVEEAWRVLLDVERIAPCLPGAQLQEIAGDEYRGVVKVKVGPITAQYKGSARFEEVDDATHAAVLVGKGRDTRGQGDASATVRMSLSERDGGTRVDIATDLSITGKVAQFGRGVMADVSAKLLAQFAESLERDVLRAPANEEPLSEPTPGPAPGPQQEPTSAAPPDGLAPRQIFQPEPEPVDLLEVGGTPVLKRVAPIVGGLVLLVLLVRLRRRARARRRARRRST